MLAKNVKEDSLMNRINVWNYLKEKVKYYLLIQLQPFIFRKKFDVLR